MKDNIIKIAFADDHELFRDGFREFLCAQEAIQFMGAAKNGKQLLDAIALMRPDIIFTDIQMPEMDGIELAKSIYTMHPDIGVIALSNFNSPHYLISMLRAGAKGYLLKSSPKKHILSAIRAVKARKYYFDEVTTKNYQDMLPKDNDVNIKELFSDREKDIIKLICDELSNREISETLSISERTVEGHRRRILEKTGAKNIAGIVVLAIKYGVYDA